MLKLLAKTCVCLTLGMTAAFGVSLDELKLFVEKGATLCKEQGNKVCFAEFNNKKGDFVKGELYMFAFDFKGITQAHGANPNITGRSLYKVKSPDGVFVIQALLKVAKEKGKGWVYYKWSHPQTKKPAPKSSYVIKLDSNYFIGAGIYK